MARTSGRVAKLRSLDLVTSWVAEGEEMTMRFCGPSLRRIIGPYLEERERRVRLAGALPRMRWWMLPTRGRVHGPGGKLFRFRVSGLLRLVMSLIDKRRRRGKKMKRKGFCWSNSMFVITC